MELAENCIRARSRASRNAELNVLSSGQSLALIKVKIAIDHENKHIPSHFISLMQKDLVHKESAFSAQFSADEISNTYQVSVE